jgi:hypothetical protein
VNSFSLKTICNAWKRTIDLWVEKSKPLPGAGSELQIADQLVEVIGRNIKKIKRSVICIALISEHGGRGCRSAAASGKIAADHGLVLVFRRFLLPWFFYAEPRWNSLG